MKRPSRRLLGLSLLAGVAIAFAVYALTRPHSRYTVRAFAEDAGQYSTATDINNLGVVVGTIEGEAVVVDRDGRARRLIYGGPKPWSGQVNDRGDVLFFLTDEYDGFAGSQPGLLWGNGPKVELTAFGRPVFAGGLAEDGSVAGTTAHPTGRVPYTAVLWRDGRTSRLPTHSGAGRCRGWAATPASHGVMVGEFWDRPWILRDGKAGYLPLLPGYTKGSALAVNDRGQIVGYCTAPPGSSYSEPGDRACLWQDGTVRDLGPVEKDSRALDVNERGQVVGTSEHRRLEFRLGDRNLLRYRRIICATLFEDGKALDLNDLIPRHSGWVLWKALSINDQGQIVGTGDYKGRQRGFVLTPVRAE